MVITHTRQNSQERGCFDANSSLWMRSHITLAIDGGGFLAVRRDLGLALRLPHARVNAVRHLDELVVGPALGDLSAAQHNDLVRVSHLK